MDLLTQGLFAGIDASYHEVFSSSPSPMWVYDVQTLRMLGVNQAALAGGEHFALNRARLLRDPVLRRAVFRGKHHLAGLQRHAVAVFEAFQDFCSLFTATFDDLGELFEQGFGHEGGVDHPLINQNQST